MNHILEHRKEFVNRMKNMYTNADQLTTKEVTVEDFQKSYPENEFTVITNDVMKSHITEIIKNVEKSNDKTLIAKAAEDIKSYDNVLVKSAQGISHRFYVKKKVSKTEEAAA